jgi:hypothetical protein
VQNSEDDRDWSFEFWLLIFLDQRRNNDGLFGHHRRFLCWRCRASETSASLASRIYLWIMVALSGHQSFLSYIAKKRSHNSMQYRYVTMLNLSPVFRPRPMILLLWNRENSNEQLGQVMLFWDADNVVAAPSRQKI